ncbi:MAG: phosphatase PAP2 family protein [Ilumatobacteraceae bacterium]|nr:phosphatase PAP2 family protein [Ilumatobacteraceae bacterium]
MESRQLRDWIPSEAQRDLTETSPAPRSHWLRELCIVVIFYYTYELVRRFAHIGNVQPRAFRNQLRLIDVERFLHIYSESAVQRAFLSARWFIKVMNVYYGTLHFIITGGLLWWVYLRRHEHYRQYRNLLGMTTALALIGYFLFPLAPPRLEVCHHGGPDCFVDTLDKIGGLWSYHSSAAKAIANPFAAMPSLHFGWALWCGTLLWSFARHPIVRTLSVIYPILTLLAIVVTANHYWLDAAGGAVIFLTASQVLGMLRRRASRKAQPALE